MSNRLKMFLSLIKKNEDPILYFILVVSFLYFFFTNDRSIVMGLVGAVGILIFGMMIVSLLALIISFGIDQTSGKESPLGKVVSFLFGIIIALFVLDFLLSFGTYLIGPSFKFVTSGTLEGTFWNCENWVSAEEYFADGNTSTHYWCDDDDAMQEKPKIGSDLYKVINN